jgi:hypothetical protein
VWAVPVAGGAPAHDAVVGLFIREDEGNRPSATRMVQQQCAATAPSTSDLIRPLSQPHLLQRPVSTFVRLVRIEGITPWTQPERARYVPVEAGNPGESR